MTGSKGRQRNGVRGAPRCERTPLTFLHLSHVIWASLSYTGSFRAYSGAFAFSSEMGFAVIFITSSYDINSSETSSVRIDISVSFKAYYRWGFRITGNKWLLLWRSTASGSEKIEMEFLSSSESDSRFSDSAIDRTSSFLISSCSIDFAALFTLRNRYYSFDGAVPKHPISSLLPFTMQSRCKHFTLMEYSHNDSTDDSDVFCTYCDGDFIDHLAYFCSIFHALKCFQLFLK